MSTETIVEIILAVAGGATVPFIVGLFVHSGAREVATLPPPAFEDRTRLFEVSGYYALIVVAAVAGWTGLVVFVLPNDHVKEGWLYGIAALSSFGLLFLSVLAKPWGKARTARRHGGAEPPSQPATGLASLYVSLAPWAAVVFVSLPFLGWVYVAGGLYEGWIQNDSADALGIPLPMAIFLLSPLAYVTFVLTSRIWGMLFAADHYRYNRVWLAFNSSANADAVKEVSYAGLLIKEDKDNWIIFCDRRVIALRKVQTSIVCVELETES